MKLKVILAGIGILLAACGGQPSRGETPQADDLWALPLDRAYRIRVKADIGVTADSALVPFATRILIEGRVDAKVVSRSGRIARVELRLVERSLKIDPPLPAMIRRFLPAIVLPEPGIAGHVYLDAGTGLVLAAEADGQRRTLSRVSAEYATLFGLAFPERRLPEALELALPRMQGRIAVTNRALLTDGRGTLAVRSQLELTSEDGRGPRGQAGVLQLFRNFPHQPLRTNGTASFMIRVPVAVGGTRFVLPLSLTGEWVFVFETD